MTAAEETTTGRSLIEAGAPVAGSMSAAAATVVFEPAAARVQVHDGFAAVLRRAAADAAGLPTGRERVRAGAALAFAVEHAVTLHRAGRAVRGDDFLAGRPGNRPVADELTETVLLAARASTDERRVRHLGYLLAEVAVSPDLDPGVVGRALRLAGALGWRQLALLAAVGRRDRVPLPMTPLDDDPRGWTTWAAREDVAELQRTGLLDPAPAQPRPGGAALPRLRMADLRLTRSGVLVHRLLVLEVLREDAVTAALADLGLPRS
ncbi:hypothetical protein E9549_16010 [Blastococcus sp. MG754426]|uniref:hypothetical protein n=1 Tax=unclassified Blastococcus TaxID=2619396 RepID=UPI001EF0D621|nr:MULTISPECIES: hypothetical protein [unclassified Blastococcus]MCF6508899.1 hypothetical protein [Blastococcus sp. MG754426]MCF6513184.1 hypothetical protein [Blastococcus sp. MG754427]